MGKSRKSKPGSLEAFGGKLAPAGNRMSSSVSLVMMMADLGMPERTACPCGDNEHENPADNEAVLERIDFSQGYVHGNVMWVSGRAYKVRHKIVDGTPEEVAMIASSLARLTGGSA